MRPGLPQVGLTESRSIGIGRPQVRASQTGPGEIRAGETGAGQVGAGKVDPGESRSAEIGVRKDGSPKIGPLEREPGEEVVGMQASDQAPLPHSIQLTQGAENVGPPDAACNGLQLQVHPFVVLVKPSSPAEAAFQATLTDAIESRLPLLFSAPLSVQKPTEYQPAGQGSEAGQEANERACKRRPRSGPDALDGLGLGCKLGKHDEGTPEETEAGENEQTHYESAGAASRFPPSFARGAAYQAQAHFLPGTALCEKPEETVPVGIVEIPRPHRDLRGQCRSIPTTVEQAPGEPVEADLKGFLSFCEKSYFPLVGSLLLPNDEKPEAEPTEPRNRSQGE